MKLLSILSGFVLCAVVATSCTIDAPSETADQQSITAEDLAATRTAEIQLPGQLSDSQITPRACFIEGFCVGAHTEFCIHTGPCAAGEARTLAAAFCRNRCGGDCSQGNILQRANCP